MSEQCREWSGEEALECGSEMIGRVGRAKGEARRQISEVTQRNGARLVCSACWKDNCGMGEDKSREKSRQCLERWWFERRPRTMESSWGPWAVKDEKRWPGEEQGKKRVAGLLR